MTMISDFSRLLCFSIAVFQFCLLRQIFSSLVQRWNWLWATIERWWYDTSGGSNGGDVARYYANRYSKHGSWMHGNSLFYSKMNAIIFLKTYAHYTNYIVSYFVLIANCLVLALTFDCARAIWMQIYLHFSSEWWKCLCSHLVDGKKNKSTTLFVYIHKMSALAFYIPISNEGRAQD